MQFGEAEVQAAVARVGADQAQALDDWQTATLGVMRDLLQELLDQLRAGQSLGSAAIGAVKGSAEVTEALRGQIAEWLVGVHTTARERMAEQLGREVQTPALLEGTLRAQARVYAEDLVAVAEREVRLAALRGESTDQIAARFEETLGARLRGHLADAGQSAARAAEMDAS